jgi:heme-degrading monooxygenase HmoA
MIYELLECEVTPGAEAAFEAAYRKASELLLRAKGCRSVRMLHGIEEPTKFRVLIQWETVENHTQDFRGSPDHKALIELIRPHYARPGLVQHYELVFDTGA